MSSASSGDVDHAIGMWIIDNLDNPLGQVASGLYLVWHMFVLREPMVI